MCAERAAGASLPNPSLNSSLRFGWDSGSPLLAESFMARGGTGTRLPLAGEEEVRLSRERDTCSAVVAVIGPPRGLASQIIPGHQRPLVGSQRVPTTRRPAERRSHMNAEQCGHRPLRRMFLPGCATVGCHDRIRRRPEVTTGHHTSPSTTARTGNPGFLDVANSTGAGSTFGAGTWGFRSLSSRVANRHRSSEFALIPHTSTTAGEDGERERRDHHRPDAREEERQSRAD